jgi:hypothetical protein
VDCRPEAGTDAQLLEERMHSEIVHSRLLGITQRLDCRLDDNVELEQLRRRRQADYKVYMTPKAKFREIYVQFESSGIEMTPKPKFGGSYLQFASLGTGMTHRDKLEDR